MRGVALAAFAALAALAALVAAGCTTPASTTTTTTTAATAAAATAATAAATATPATTRYRAGDYVVYRFTGAGLAPATLREEITEQRGDRLTIHVTSTKGEADSGAASGAAGGAASGAASSAASGAASSWASGEASGGASSGASGEASGGEASGGEAGSGNVLKREWIQVVTDTPENQRAEKVEELYELVHDEASGSATAVKRVKLRNADNRDLYHLYAWTLPPSTLAPPENVTREPEIVTIVGKQYTCMTEKGSFGTAPDAMPYSFATCAEFLWTNGPALIRASAADDAAVVWQRDVVEVGKR